MQMTRKYEITLREPFRTSPWARTFRAILVPTVLIGMGVLLDSSAMQWMGFVVTILTALGIALGKMRIEGMTIEEARKRLDEIERETPPT